MASKRWNETVDSFVWENRSIFIMESGSCLENVAKSKINNMKNVNFIRKAKFSFGKRKWGRGNIRRLKKPVPSATMDATQIALSEAKAGLPKIADKDKESDVGVILSVSGPGT